MKKIFIIILLSLILVPSFVFAVDPIVEGLNTTATTADLSPKTSGSGITLFQTTVGKIIGAVIGLLGMLFVVLMIIGGVTWLTSAGDSTKVDKGKNYILNATLGLLMVFLAYAIASYLITNLGFIEA